MMGSDENDVNVERQVQIMTTMHFVLSGARASTVSEAVGRSGMYLTTVSMTLVALGFISSATSMGEGFYLFAFVLLLCLILLGTVSFDRVLQTGVQDLQLGYDEARIREFYVSVSPGIDRWFDLPVGDHRAGQAVLGGGGSRAQILLTAASMVGGVNCAVIGVFVGLLVIRFSSLSLFWAAGLGAAAFIVASLLHLRREFSLFSAMRQRPDHSAPA